MREKMLALVVEARTAAVEGFPSLAAERLDELEKMLRDPALWLREPRQEDLVHRDISGPTFIKESM